jgi:hypothetical protein
MTTNLAVSSVNVAQRQGSSNNFSKQQRNFPPNNYSFGRRGRGRGRGRGPPQFFHNAGFYISEAHLSIVPQTRPYCSKVFSQVSNLNMQSEEYTIWQ